MVHSSLFGSHTVLLSSVARVASAPAPVAYVAPVAAPAVQAPVAPPAPVADLSDAADQCSKCGGSGHFISSKSGRIVGDCFACNGSGRVLRAGPAAAIDVSAIATAFASARANDIKRPMLRLGAFVFSRAPDHGKNAGAIYVKARDGGEYLGKVADGQFHPVRSCDAVTTADVIKVAADPHNAAKAYGARWGICSCCGRDLSNAESVRLGIGPVCRDKFGW